MKDLARIMRPSSAARWVACTSWPALHQKIDPPDTAGRAAQEGTRLHEHMESYLATGHPLEGCTPGHRAVVREARRQFYRHVATRRHYTWKVEVPLEIPVGGLLIPGTADVVGLSKATRTLAVVDWKFGTRHRVTAEGNPQLLMYARGALQLADFDVDWIQLHIIQPRMPHKPSAPETWCMTYDRFQRHMAPLHDAAKRIADGETDYNPNAAICRWCAVKDHCPAYGSDKTTQDVAILAGMFDAAGQFINEENRK